MTSISVQKNVPSAKSAGAPTQVLTLSDFPASASAEHNEDDLDALMRNLSGENPAFGELLVETGKELAPLATATGGCPTLTSLRMAAGLTQSKLAQLILQKQSNVSLMESGQRENIQRDTMKRMCAALNCDMNTLDAAMDASVAMLQESYARQEAQHAAAQVERRCA